VGEGERYAEFEPPASLRPFVRVIWTYAAPHPTGDVQRIAPDGCPELILDIGSPYEEQTADGWRLQPPALFAGQMTRPIAIRPVGPVELVAVRFEPDGARDWLGGPLAQATDGRLDMTARLAGVTAPAGDPEGQVAVMAALLEDLRQHQGWSIDPVVRAEIEALQSDAAPPARTPAEHRALQRRFADRVGVPPRILRSVLRFRRVFDHAAHGDPDALGWLEAGLQAGYFDQPQMARDFRRFLGCTATEWARDQAELARHIASQSYKPGPPHLS
jgi:AraC-like DNA-binding protein